MGFKPGKVLARDIIGGAIILVQNRHNAKFVAIPSCKYLITVDAIEDLEQTEGNADRAYAEVAWDRIKSDWIKRNGVKKSSGRQCVGRLLGKKGCRSCGLGNRCTPLGEGWKARNICHPTLPFIFRKNG
ncbi:hypothetical protein JCM14036_02890 [Desulfotomaculum defluvii]